MDVSRLSLQSLAGELTVDLPEFTVPPADPVALAGEWIARAIQNGVREPGGFALATADGEGVPSSRFVLAKGFDQRGLLFVSQKTSRKGRDIAANPHASASFYWQELRLQLHLAGRIEPISDEESDALFSPRPLTSKAVAAVSQQSQPLADENAFAAEVSRIIAEGLRVPRPERWTGYRLRPDRIEFWSGDKNRLHRRLQYERSGAQWEWQRLQP
jgi:pyridoxamine 5'-phosphate oxidase